jgi:predicted dithiol-disulfide oxidoreductase (DUF899 family)
MNATAGLDHKVVSKSEWLKATSEFLAKEKELTRLNDEVSRLRRELPWTIVEKEYVFDGPQGKVKLSDLFDGRSQLATYHFMFAPEWTEGCRGCSYLTDHMDGALEHLAARDVSLVLVSRAPLAKLEAFKKRMGWHLPWVSSSGCDFNRDYAVTFTKAEVESKSPGYNLATLPPYAEENPGMSFFIKMPDGKILHTYSIYARGLEPVVSAYAILDRAPKGRDEDSLPMPMSWVKLHDEYEHSAQGAASCCHNKASQ